MSARGVAGVLVPNILRITLSQSRHQQIARDLGENRCAGNAEASRIAVNDCGVRNGQSAHRPPIDDDVVRCHGQTAQRASHRQHTCLVDVDAVDLSYGRSAERECHRALTYFRSKPNALLVRQPL